MEKSKITFHCGDAELNRGFEWAKETALSYANDGDPVGPWYEASLPGRSAFCMRDVSHQTFGAQALGLADYTKNMLLRFAQSVAESRDFCSFWEIDKHYRPAPVDYTDDGDFWYNLPANFDVADACYRAFQLTGDRAYLDSSDFRRFYRLTATKYISRWDKNGDGIPERRCAGRRGIPSYDEQYAQDAEVMADMLTVEARGMRSIAELFRLNGRYKAAAEADNVADRVFAALDGEWWDADAGRYYFARMPGGEMLHVEGAKYHFLHWDAVTDAKRRGAMLDIVDEESRSFINVEGMSHLPYIYYRFGEPERGLYWLKKIVSPELKRREYPEVSYSAVGSFVFGLMGITADAGINYKDAKNINWTNNLPDKYGSAELYNLPLFGGEIDLIVKNGVPSFTNRTGGVVRFNGALVEDGDTL